MVKFLAYLICYIVYPFSYLIPRSANVWVFGSYRGAYNDNSKYLFLYALDHYKHKKIAWISTSKETVEKIRSLGYPSYYVGSLKGLCMSLRAKYWFVSDNTSDILFCLSGGATIVNLWHGVPMKCIEFGITKGELAKRYVNKEFWDCYYHPASFIRPDFMVSTTDFFDEVFSKSFRIKKEQCVQVGCPRNQMLLIPKENVRSFVERNESSYTKDLIDKISTYDRVFVYMPTWRDSQRTCFANGFDLRVFNERLKELNAYALMKPHANTIVNTQEKYSNLEFVHGNVDMYCILPFTDILITDYSSVMYDYLLMKDKGIILFHYDFDEYVKEREFIFDLKENVIGRTVHSFAELLQAMGGDCSLNVKDRDRIMEKFWGDTVLHNPCVRLIECLHLNE